MSDVVERYANASAEEQHAFLHGVAHGSRTSTERIRELEQYMRFYREGVTYQQADAIIKEARDE